MQTDIVIIGGGLAGLALADRLHGAGVDFQLLEARARLGGRIKAAYDGDTAFDLGPSWFWPGQPRMAELIKRLGLTVFDQHCAGAIHFEDENGRVHRGMGYASMEGSWRIRGGMQAIIDGLVAELPAERLHLGIRVQQLSQAGAVMLSDGSTICARHMVLALPPRVAATLPFSPPLAPQIQRELEAIPTWMGGQAKFVAIYDSAFWREDGSSGDAMSRRGPLAEIHDASAISASPAALFGFVGVPAPMRKGHAEAIKTAAVAQLARLFGDRALSPKQVILSDWAFASESASVLDHSPPNGHPNYGLPHALRALWNGSLHLGSTEVADEFGGYLEGALCRAETLGKKLGGAG